jgi:Ribonuclease G/E
MIELRAAASPGEIRVAAVEGDALLDYAIWRPGAPDGIGDLYRGRVISVVPAMAGAFVALGDAEGFLPDSEGAKGLTEGSVIAVRITRSAQGGKGPRLTARSAKLPLHQAEGECLDHGLPLVGPPGLIQRGADPLAELASRYPDALVAVDDRSLLASLRPALGDRVRFAPTAFDDAQAAAIDALEQPDVELPNGARLSIHPTPALVAIDVDAGGSMATSRRKDAHHVALNHAVLPALAAQIRLRNLSGAIVVDLAGLSVRKRAALGPGLAEALAGDPLGPRFLGFTALGLAEIVRPRRRPPLHELLAGPHAAGLAALRSIAAALDPDPRRLPILRASPPVAAALQQDPVALADLARRTGRDLVLRADPALPATGWITEDAHG